MSAPRVVVIGCGNLSQRQHLPSLAQLQRMKRCVFAGVCDLNGELAASAAKKFGARAAYTDIETMLREAKPDGVAVIVPVTATAAVAGAILRKGYPTILEKPPGHSAAACKSLIRSAKAGHAKHMVAFNRRFCPPLVQGRAEVLKRGAIKGAGGLMYRHRRHDPDFWATAIHSIDALRFLGGDVDRVIVDKRRLRGDRRHAFTFIFEYANGGVGTLNVRPEAGVSIERYEIFGAECVALVRSGVGWLIDQPGFCDLYECGKAVQLPDPFKPFAHFPEALSEPVNGGFFGEEASFVEALRSGKWSGPTVAESLPSVEIALAMQAGRSWRRR